ncbi:MAG: DUF5916 domain-containing protein [Flavobacteriaceae bacterium]
MGSFFSHTKGYGLLLFLSTMAFGQDVPKMLASFTNYNILIDGSPSEEVWNTAEVATTRWQHFPTESQSISQPTEVRILYDEKNLYILCKAYSVTNKYITPSLRRDFSGGASDKINFVIDTYSDGINAYMFGSNPFGVKSDLLVSNGGIGEAADDINRTWDVDYDVESKIYEGYFIMEMKIPFGSINFPEGSTQWRFNFFRLDTQTNERTSWTRIPQVYKDFNLAFMGVLEFDRPLGKSNAPLSIIPYVNGIASHDFTWLGKDQKLNLGGDLKIPINNGLNLDLTLNPDFSQVEVDDEIINLTQFEIVLPEKRQFFLQNSDLFSNYGAERTVTPFLTRRIGVARDLEGNNIQNRIIAGVRLSGKASENMRLGFLNMVTDEDVKNHIPLTNNTVLSLQQSVFARSNLKLLVINRQRLKDYDFSSAEEEYNRMLGLEYDLNSKDNVWKGRFFAYKSFTPLENEKSVSGGAQFSRETRNQNINLEYAFIGEDFKADLGLLRRVGVMKFSPFYSYFFYPKKGNVNTIELRQNGWFWVDPNKEESLLERSLLTTAEMTFKNQSKLSFRFFDRKEYIANPFDPTGIHPETPLEGDQFYFSRSATIQFSSDRRKKLSFISSQNYGSFFDGMKYSFVNNFSYRFQPRLVTSLKLNYDRIDLGNSIPLTNLWLFGPKFDFSFSKSVFWSTNIQLSSQSENLGFNSRFQWRFNSLSDLYIVYNDNYFTYDRLMPRYRSLNIKLTYWIFK